MGLCCVPHGEDLESQRRHLARRKNRQISTDNKNDPADIHNDTIIIDESSEEEESKNNISDCDSSIFNFIVNC